ncbi:MAG: hypothetical protein Q8Q76_09910 [Methylotenera sp.]|nr:hypothetical protein [Methylotenera sp.]
MMGLMVLGVLAVYLLVSFWVTKKAVSWAKANNKKPWVWGGLAAFVMYNLVFWDLIPTLVMHKYYCATQAGFWMYKTPEQWKQENPGVIDSLARSLEPKKIEKLSDNTKRYWLTQHFYNDVQQEEFSHALMIEKKMFFDAKNNELIAKSVNFWRGTPIWAFNTFDEFRQSLGLGWGSRQCDVSGKSPTDNFTQYVYQFWKSGENK